MSRSPVLALLMLISVVTTPALAQVTLTEEPEFWRFGSGDLEYRAGMTMSKVSVDAAAVVFLPDEGWSADIFLARHDLSEGWIRRANEWGYNAFAYTAVGTGDTALPPSDDLKILSEKNLYGVYQTCLAPDPDITVAHGLNAAFALKARSMDIRGGKVLVLIDPVAPPGVTSEKTPTIEAVREERSNMREKLWAKWGIGKKPGHADPDSDIGAEGYERLIERYEFVQPGYWASARTGFQGGLGISAGALLKDLPVLIVGTPNRSGQQRRNEAELIEWLEGKHCRVERMELDELGLEGIGGLPMAGDHSQKIFDEIVRWGQATIRSMPAPAEEESR